MHRTRLIKYRARFPHVRNAERATLRNIQDGEDIVPDEDGKIPDIKGYVYDRAMFPIKRAKLQNKNASYPI